MSTTYEVMYTGAMEAEQIRARQTRPDGRPQVIERLPRRSPDALRAAVYRAFGLTDWLSLSAIAERAGVDYKDANACLQGLIAKGLVEREQHLEGRHNGGPTQRYRLRRAS